MKIFPIIREKTEESLDDRSRRITKIIKETAEQIIAPREKTPDKLSIETKHLLEKRRKLITEDTDTIE